jgi:tetratricopeptide (TPR) repeat protein
MIKNFYVFVIIFFLTTAPVWAQTADAAAGYGSLSDYLDSIYGADANTGLTAFPVLNVPMGGRSEGMAAAFGAVADDISFLEYNPAGSSMLARSELAFFHNNWIADTKIEGAVFASRLNDFGFAAGAKWLYTPFTEYNALGSRVSKGYYSEAAAVLNGSYNFLPGYYFSGISLGINLKGAFRFVPDYTEDDIMVSGSGNSQSTAMVMADLGALTRFNLFKFYDSRDQNTSAALTIRNLGPPAKDEPLPTAFSAALSYKPLRPLLFSFDLSFPLNTRNPAFSEKPYWAVGTAVDISAFLSMRMGLQFKAGNFRFAVGSAVNLQKISLDFNYSLDLMTQLQSLNRVSVGIRFDLGDQGRKQKTDQVDSLYLQGLDAYAQGNYQEAQFYFGEALKLSPRFDPAREALETIRRSLEVEERINDLQRLDFAS